MRMVNLAAVAAFAILAASPALAGDPRGGGHPGGGGGCGGSCGGGGGHRPPPSPPHGGGFNSNINVNVNANANANANAFAGGAAGSYFNARAYNVGSVRGGGHGGSVYVGGGYGGDGGGYYSGGAIYNEEVYEGRTCASAPFGYVVHGFGRNERRAPACVANTSVCREDVDRGGRYGYSERRGCDGGRREEHYDSRRRSGASYESYESYEEYGSYTGGYIDERGYGSGGHDRGYSDDRRDCGGCRSDDRDRSGHAPAPEPRYEAPRYAEPRYEEPYRPQAYAPPVHDAPAYESPAYEVPMTPNQYYGIGDQSPPPRQYYAQEPGERG